VCGRISSGFLTHEKCTHSPILSSYSCWRSNRHTGKIMTRIYNGLAFRGLYYLTDLCVQNLKATSFLGKLKEATVVPLPVSRKDYLKRGFDPAEIVGKRLAERLDLRYSKEPGPGRVILVSDILKPKRILNYAGNLKKNDIYSVSLFRRQLINKISYMDPVDP
jgi:predicted amidophosphoribosyltransferase